MKCCNKSKTHFYLCSFSQWYFLYTKQKWRFCLNYQDIATLPIFALLGNIWHMGLAQGCLKMKEMP